MISTKLAVQVKPPALPQAPDTYTRRFQDQYSNVLRLFFNLLDNAINSVVSSDSGGAALFFPHAVNYSETTQAALATDTAYVVSFPLQFDNVIPEGVVINNTVTTVKFPGMYEIEAHLQYFSSNSASKEVTVWIRINDVDVPYSAQRITVAKSGYGQLAFATHMPMLADDELKIMWATDNTNVSLQSLPPSAPYPGIPSALLNIEHASNILI